MQKISPQVIDDIRHQVNIIDVIGEYVDLKKAGRNYSGLCPFHNEKTPSFSVTEEKQIYKCFGCGKGGNVFNFIQDIEGITFPEAVKKVADFAHIPLELETTQISPQTKKRQRLLQLHEKAVTIYQHLLLNTKVGESSLNYLMKRGLTEETIQHFSLGFAPKETRFLKEILLKEGFSEAELKESGLFIINDHDEWFDRFQNRIMYPLRDTKGDVVGFSGRIIEEDPQKKQAKYLNSPETLLFEKREMLYNFSNAKGEMRRQGNCYLFEGFMDVISAYQGGVKNAVASMGTSFTTQQVQKIQKATEELVLTFDGDDPGQHAIAKSLKELEKFPKLRLKVVMLPDGLDPDEFLKKYGTESFQNYLKKEQKTPFQFQESYLKNQYDLSNEQGLSDFLKELAKEIAKISSLMERDILLHNLVEDYHVSYDILKEYVQGFVKEQQGFQLQQMAALTGTSEVTYEKLTQGQKASRLLLYRIFNDEMIRQEVRKIPDFSFLNDTYQELYLLMDTYALEGGEMTDAAFIEFLQNNEKMRQLATTILMMEVAPDSSTVEFQELLVTLKKEDLQEKIKEKQQLQKEAHRLGDKSLELKLTMEIIQLTKTMKTQR